MINIIDDVSTLTTIPVKALEKLNDKVFYAIIDGVRSDIEAGKTMSGINFGWFTLYINYEDLNNLKTKVVLNNDFSKSVIKTINTKENPLENALHKSLTEKILNTYKDIC